VRFAVGPFRSEAKRSDTGGSLNQFARTSLVVGGTVAAVNILKRAMKVRTRYKPREKPTYGEFPMKVLVVGGGFAGFMAAKTLCDFTEERDDVGVLVISRENYFAFWPMVPGIIGSEVDIGNIAQPLRRPLIEAGASFRRTELKDVDFERKIVVAEGGKEFPYDHLILALGSQPNFFGVPGVKEHSLALGGLADALKIRNRVIERFEQATLEPGELPDPRLTFVVIGGGATGVETAAEIHALVHEALTPDFPNIDIDEVRIFVIEGGQEILGELDPALRRVASMELAARGIKVITGVRATEVMADRVKLDDGRMIRTENVVWTAGIRPNTKLEDLDLPLTERDGVIVDERLRVPGRPGVWAIGDSAAIPQGDGKLAPPQAQAAVQEGRAAARNVLAAIDGREDRLEEFEYRPLGLLVELGSRFAVNEVMGVRFSGFTAALFWRAVYLSKLESPQNRARVAADWILGLLFRPAATEIRDLV
jgi:NADH:ubiquinone reductase (H+-translocating)